ncbi:hypothetical protein [Aliidiomarina quisquiliarum]|uniref:hypothetical protein n=1 Tax=Aliidiomarina quisquiliarum TaxID=2938947 RepID=UPI00208F3081|nr:hypothetical protein [Aliidiomarina quisquiliarum]MCO4321722.1 hypothetical protein [Aliidiomarina quisquiliarum]
MNNNRADEFDKAKEIALEFENKGYTVFIAPSLDKIPIDTKGYQPSLLAVKDNGGVVVEIRPSLKRLPIQKFQEISQQISANEGWKFALVTLDDSVNKVVSIVDADLPDQQLLKEKIKDIDTLVSMNMLPNALISLSTQLESWLRIKSRLVNLPLDLCQTKRMINHLYSDGELSMEQTDKLNELIELRNKVMHGFDVTITEKQVAEGILLLNEIITSIESTGSR